MRTFDYMRVTPSSVPDLEMRGYRVAGATRFSNDGIGVLMVREPWERDDRPAGEEAGGGED